MVYVFLKNLIVEVQTAAHENISRPGNGNRWRSLHESMKWLTSVFCLIIRAGPLKGHKWIVSTSVNFLKGNYEPQKTLCVEQVIQQGMVAVGVGAHVGYYSLILAKGVGKTGAVYSFEPRKRTDPF